MENEKLVERLQAPVRIGGTTSEDSYEVYDDLRLEAATALTAAQARIRELEGRADHYGVALMMIRAGCADPARFAGNILDDKQPIDIDIEDELP